MKRSLVVLVGACGSSERTPEPTPTPTRAVAGIPTYVLGFGTFADPTILNQAAVAGLKPKPGNTKCAALAFAHRRLGLSP